MKTIVEILVDNSNSMGPYEVKKNKGKYLLPDGSTRMSLAKRILKDLIPNLDYASKIVVRKFHSTNPLDQPTVLEMDTIYNTALNVENLKQIIDKIPDPEKTGGTPITDAVKYSIDKLRKFSDWDRKIILVTDGEETGKGNYDQAAKEAMALYGIPCNVFIVGILQSAEAELKAKELAANTGGDYINVKAIKYNKATIKSKLRKITNKIVTQSVEKKVTVGIKSKEQTPAKTEDSSDESNPKNESKASDKNKKKNETNRRLNTIEDSIKSNTEILGLINKQIASIQEELSETKSAENEFEEDDKVIVKENQEEKDRVGRKSEKYLFELLSKKYGDSLIWLNEEKEQGGDHDFKVVDFDGSVDFYIECKGTKTNGNIFYLTKYEWRFFLRNTKNYQIYFIKNIDKEPVLIKIDNFLDWILKEKVVPYTGKKRMLEKDRILMMIK